MTETQQRFLRAIAERVPSSQVVEVHLFPPIRQGGVETGVAVVAEDPRRPVAEQAADAAGPLAAAMELGERVEQREQVAQVEHGEQVEHAASAEEPDAEVVSDEASPEATAQDAAELDAVSGDEVEAMEDPSTADASSVPDQLPVQDAPSAADDSAPLVAADSPTGDGANGESPAHEPARPRYTIHTARYRLTLKGVDRGKWEVDVVAEADAPLDAVDAVVRGVQRRAGEGAEPDRLTTEAFLEALDAPLAQLER